MASAREVVVTKGNETLGAVPSAVLILCLSFLISFGPVVTTLHHIPRESPELASRDLVSFV